MIRRRNAVEQAPAPEYDALFPMPCCTLGIRTKGGVVREIKFLPLPAEIVPPRNEIAEEVCVQLSSYLADPAFRFSLKLDAGGTPFQREVWSQMLQIQPGFTVTYGEVARRLKSSPRAVGQACGANPVPIVVPCHRIIANGGLGGFAHKDKGFPLNVKHWLLLHEQRQW